MQEAEKETFVCKRGGERTLLRGDRDAETENSHSENTARESQTGFCLPSRGHCQTSVSVARCFVSAISPDKGMELFSLSHQQFGLSTIRPIGPKPLRYCQLTEANTGKPSTHVTCFM